MFLTSRVGCNTTFERWPWRPRDVLIEGENYFSIQFRLLLNLTTGSLWKPFWLVYSGRHFISHGPLSRSPLLWSCYSGRNQNYSAKHGHTQNLTVWNLALLLDSSLIFHPCFMLTQEQASIVSCLALPCFSHLFYHSQVARSNSTKETLSCGTWACSIFVKEMNKFLWPENEKSRKHSGMGSPPQTVTRKEMRLNVLQF